VSLAVPAGVPPEVWANIQVVLQDHRDRAARTNQDQNHGQADNASGARHVISRRLFLERVPVTRVEYTFAGQRFAFLAVGQMGSERFWAQQFPPRWSRVSRFLKALARDLQGDSGTPSEQSSPHHRLTRLDDFRARKAGEETASSEGNAGSGSADNEALARDRFIRIHEVTAEDGGSGGTSDSDGE
jgi:hypothetical protein